MTLTTEIIEKGNYIICYLNGRIVYETENLLKQAVEEILHQKMKKNIIMNFRDLTYINSSGIGLLVKILREVNGAGGELRLCSLQPAILEVFKITNLNQVFKIFSTEEEALV
ncbi:MAG: STAS domain-containing protein [Candidatus Wallbacteria bacterium]|nr:STAS domain-containing protein [Candidatus Wallbacteria bacterium]